MNRICKVRGLHKNKNKKTKPKIATYTETYFQNERGKEEREGNGTNQS